MALAVGLKTSTEGEKSIAGMDGVTGATISRRVTEEENEEV